MNQQTRSKRIGRLREEMRGESLEPEATASTSDDGLLRAAETGQYEALVAQARLAQPIAMVTPEEREAELRAAGKWPADKPRRKPKARRKEPKPPERELTPNEQYIAEHCQWRERGPNDYPRTQHRVGQCLTEYDPLTGKLIGDGYRRFGDDDW